jgi:lipopolysaccharide biosynthesis protein
MTKRIWLSNIEDAVLHGKDAVKFFTQCRNAKDSDYDFICEINIKEKGNG